MSNHQLQENEKFGHNEDKKVHDVSYELNIPQAGTEFQISGNHFHSG